MLRGKRKALATWLKSNQPLKKSVFKEETQILPDHTSTFLRPQVTESAAPNTISSSTPVPPHCKRGTSPISELSKDKIPQLPLPLPRKRANRLGSCQSCCTCSENLLRTQRCKLVRPAQVSQLEYVFPLYTGSPMARLFWL